MFDSKYFGLATLKIFAKVMRTTRKHTKHSSLSAISRFLHLNLFTHLTGAWAHCKTITDTAQEIKVHAVRPGSKLRSLVLKWPTTTRML